MREILIQKLVEKILKYTSPDDWPSANKMAAHIADVGAYHLDGGDLGLTSRDAVKLLRDQGIPMSVIGGIAREAAARIDNPALKTLALYDYQGTTFDQQIIDEESQLARGSL